MKAFIKKICIFLLLPLLVGIALFLLIISYTNKLYINNPIKIESNVSTIYIGDSHIELAIDDRIIPNSKNFATSSESFYFSYFKLKILLKNNPFIKKVYLGFSYHNLSNYYDKFIYGNYAPVIAPKYFFLLPFNEQSKIFYWNKYDLLPFMISVTKCGIHKIIYNYYHSYRGGYSNNFTSTMAANSSIDARINFQFYNSNGLNPFSKINIYYFSKIVALCKSKNVDLYALNTPLNNYYIKKVPLEYKIKLNKIIVNEQVKYIDLSNLKFEKKFFIPDGDHVSKLGAEATSHELSKARKDNDDVLLKARVNGFD